MGRQLSIVLEYDGENPIRNTFLCEINDFSYSELRYWEDLYDLDLCKTPYKKNSLKILEILDGYGCHSWGINNIVKKIERGKEEIKLDTELDEQGKKNLNEIISDLHKLHSIAIEKCNENNIEPEKCYINWWIS